MITEYDLWVSRMHTHLERSVGLINTLARRYMMVDQQISKGYSLWKATGKPISDFRSDIGIILQPVCEKISFGTDKSGHLTIDYRISK